MWFSVIAAGCCDKDGLSWLRVGEEEWSGCVVLCCVVGFVELSGNFGWRYFLGFFFPAKALKVV